jgi:hypothetical protein
MDAELGGVHQDHPDTGTLLHRPLCIQAEQLTTQVYMFGNRTQWAQMHCRGPGKERRVSVYADRQKIYQEGSTVILIALVWDTPWYPAGSLPSNLAIGCVSRSSV